MIHKLTSVLAAATLIGTLIFTAGCQTFTQKNAGKPGKAEESSGPDVSLAGKAVPAGMSKPPGAAPGIDPSMLKVPEESYRVGPGDVLEIDFIGSPDGPQRTYVGPDGKIYFNLLSGLQVWGYTLEETRSALMHGLTEFFQNPQVSLTLREVHSRRVQVMGRVNVPGLYELNQPTTVLDAISQAKGAATSRLAGSTEEMADLEHSFLLRKGRVIPVNFERLIRQGDTSQNIYLQADDLLLLPSAMNSQIFVLGAVNTPRAVPYRGRTTLITALAACRGLAINAKPKHVAIVRGSLQDPSLAVVDANAILKGKMPDILLSPRDIVYVPASSPYSLRSYVDLIVSSFARSVAANEAAAVTGSEQPVGFSLGAP
ncbi:MAG: polysaccharide export protein Wza [Verrucomicrobiales bacterium]|nr:polysaccharide export protein Wza [Verrucomicrobiales bacterium]